MKKKTLALGTMAVLVTLGAACLVMWSGGDVSPSATGKTEGRAAPATHPLSAVLPPGEAASSPVLSYAADLVLLSTGEKLRMALASDDPQIRARAIQRRLRKWARDDALGAARFAMQLDDAMLRNQAMRTVAQTWGEMDPGAATAWAAALPDEIERRVFLEAVCFGLGGRDPAEGVQLADKLGLRDDGVLENLTAQWAVKDEGAALAWAYQRPAGLDRDRFMQQVAFVESQKDPARAARLVVEQIPAGSEQTEAVISVVNQWARRDPASATAWVAAFPPGSMQDRALGELRGIMASQ